MALQEQLDAFEACFSAGETAHKASPETAALLARGIAELVASGRARNTLRAGDRAPAFKLRNRQGQTISSGSLLKHGPLVLMFYRGSWCPYCNMELDAMKAALPKLAAAGARVVAVSPELASIQDDGQLTMLSDPHNRTAALFGLAYELPVYVADLYRKLGNDLPRLNGDDSWTLPMTARFVIGSDGVVLYSEVHPDYTIRAEPENVLPVLRALHLGAR
ncbi:peroxiredoxin-like family protein [Rugamonas sp.]|uniref:peroxiredoxin-like family protein n=1 Tax=Rugamonas sp. TaxID=1926287 RepID=UPI0025E19564|nr:peroxiredoxin-like family protein [Rugamonas sp.]